MNLPEMQDQKKVLVRMGYIHIAISVGSREKVDAITEKLYEAGYDVLSIRVSPGMAITRAPC